MHVDKIDHVAVNHSIDEIAGDAATEETEANLGDTIAETQNTAPEEDGDQGRRGEAGEKYALAGKHAPSGSRISDMNDVEKTANHANRSGLAVSWKRQTRRDLPFCELI